MEDGFDPSYLRTLALGAHFEFSAEPRLYSAPDYQGFVEGGTLIAEDLNRCEKMGKLARYAPPREPLRAPGQRGTEARDGPVDP